MQRFFVEKVNPTTSDPDLFHQLKNVLRLKPADTVILLDNSGFEYESEIRSFEKNTVTFRILSKKKNENEPAVQITLYQALPKKMELFELVLQKGTEIGVKKFVPLITERTERQALSKKDRLLRILKEATEQSGRGIIPKLTEPIAFENVIAKWEKGSASLAYLFDSSGKPFSHVMLSLSKHDAINIFTGPEGGFSPEEITKAKEKGVSVVSLGPRTLRTETAGIVIPALFLLSDA